MMDKAPEAAAICISAFPLYESPSVARSESSCIIAYSDVIHSNYADIAK